MGGCRLLPRSCVPPNVAAVDQEDEQVVREFIDQVWNYRWLPGDWYYFLPPQLRNALQTFLDPGFVRYRRAIPRVTGQPGELKQGSGIFGLGGCVRRLREVSPHVKICIHDLMSNGGRVLAVLVMTGPNPLPGLPPFQSMASVLYTLTGQPGDRRIAEDWALSDGLAIENLTALR